MSGQQTKIKNPDSMSEPGKEFAFDYSYWSHDGFSERADGYMEPKNSKYADQVCLLFTNAYTQMIYIIYLIFYIHKDNSTLYFIYECYI